jgi:hypothetical protein
LRQRLLVNGEPQDAVLYSLVAEDFLCETTSAGD